MKKFISFKKILFFIILLIIGGLVASTVYFYSEYQKVKNNPDLISQEETKTVTNNIKKFMELPADEEPTLATITDQEKLKEQDFFKNAQNGDKVLIYTNARKAILYRPSTRRVIGFAPLVLGPTEGVDQQAEQSQQQKISIAIYNWTQTAGLTSRYEEMLSKVVNVSVVNKSNAAKNDYTKTMVIDLTGTLTEESKKIAQVVGGEVVSSLPEGESSPEADILVIVGE